MQAGRLILGDCTNIYMDTNIWLDYIWSLEMQKTKRETLATKIIDDLDSQKHFAIFSPFIIAEISNHLADWFLLKKVIKSGYSYREFKKERKNHTLTLTEKNKIDEIIERIGSKEYIDTISIESISTEELEKIFTLTNKQMDFFDALHIITAEKKECKYFITRDSELRKRVQPLINNKTIPNKMSIITPKNFYRKYIQNIS